MAPSNGDDGGFFPEDLDLVVLARQGAQPAAAALYRRHREPVGGWCRKEVLQRTRSGRGVPEGHDLEEIVEDVLDCAFVEAIKTYQPGHNKQFRSWWIHLTRCELYRFFGRDRRRLRASERFGHRSEDLDRDGPELDLADPADIAGEAVDRIAFKSAVRRTRHVLAQMPSLHEKVLVAFARCGELADSNLAAAQELGMPLEEFKPVLRQARSGFRRLWHSFEDGPLLAVESLS